MTKKKNSTATSASKPKAAPVAKNPTQLLKAVGETLLKNLSTTPPNLWATPVQEALQSAFSLGVRTRGDIKEAARAAGAVNADEGEDRVLDKGTDTSLDEAAHEVVMAIGRAIAASGIRPDQLKIRCDAFSTNSNEQYFGLVITIPPAIAQRLPR